MLLVNFHLQYLWHNPDETCTLLKCPWSNTLYRLQLFPIYEGPFGLSVLNDIGCSWLVQSREFPEREKFKNSGDKSEHTVKDNKIHDT